MCASDAACATSFGSGSECTSGPLFVESGSGLNKSYACTIPTESSEAWLLRRGSISLDCEGLEGNDGRCAVGLTVNVTGDAISCEATGCQGGTDESRLYCTGATCACESGTCGNALVTSLLGGVTGPVQLECAEASSILHEDGQGYPMDCSFILTGLPITSVDLACVAGTCVGGATASDSAEEAGSSSPRSVPQVEPSSISVAAPILAALPVATLTAAGLFVATYALAAGDVLRAKKPSRDAKGTGTEGVSQRTRLDSEPCENPLQVPRTPTWSWRLRKDARQATRPRAALEPVASIPIETSVAGDAEERPSSAPAEGDKASAQASSRGLAWGVEVRSAVTGFVERRFTRQKSFVPVVPLDGFDGTAVDSAPSELPRVALDPARSAPPLALASEEASDGADNGKDVKLALTPREVGRPRVAVGNVTSPSSANHRRVSVLAFDNLCVSVRLSRGKAASRKLAVAAKALGHAAAHPAETLTHRSERHAGASASLDLEAADQLCGTVAAVADPQAEELHAAAEFVAALHSSEEYHRELEPSVGGALQVTDAMRLSSQAATELVPHSSPSNPVDASGRERSVSTARLPAHQPATRRTCSMRMVWSALSQRPDLEDAGAESSTPSPPSHRRSLLDALLPKRQPWTVLAHATGELHAGELTGILGPSGGGKTTLLGALAGSATDLGGDATLKGRVLVDGRARRLGEVAFVPQADAFIPTLTTRECVHYSAALRVPRGTPADAVRANVAATLAELGLQAVADSPVGGPGGARGLSGGERRRVSIAMELVTDPSILLLDEPTSGLDSHASSRVVETLRRLARAGRIVAASLHSPGKDDFECLDNVVLVSHGRVLYHGSPLGAQHVIEDAQRPLAGPNDRAVKLDADSGEPSNVGRDQSPAESHPSTPSRSSPRSRDLPESEARLSTMSPRLEHRPNLAETLLEVASDPVAIRRILAHGAERRLREAVLAGATRFDSSRAASAARASSIHKTAGGSVCRASYASIASAASETSEFAPKGSSKRLLASDIAWTTAGPSASSVIVSKGLSGASPQSGGLSPAALKRLDALDGSLGEPQIEEDVAGTSLGASSPALPAPEPLKRASFSMQLAFMCWRTLADVWRSPALLRTHTAVALVAGVLLGAIYWQLDGTNVGVQNRLGATFFVLAFLGFTSLSTTDLLLNERRTVAREVRAGYYGPAPYLISKLVADGLLLRALPALLVWAPMYHMAGMRADASAKAIYVLGICGFSATVGATSVAVTALADTAGLAALAMNMLLLFGLAFAGFLVQVSSMPGVLRWIHYLSFFYYAMEATVSSQIDGQSFTLDAAGYSSVSNVKGSTYLETLGFESTYTVRDLGILAGFYYAAVVIALLAFVAKLPRPPRQSKSP